MKYVMATTGFLQKHSKYALAVAGAVAGAVLGTVVQDLADSKLRLFGAAVAFVVIALFVFMIMQSDLITSRKEVDADLLKTLEGIARDVASAADGHEVLNDRLLNRMSKLETQFGLRVNRLMPSETRSMTAENDPSARLILSVTREIYILDLISDDGGSPDNKMNQDLLGDVLGQLLQQVAAAPQPVVYRRIVQVADLDRGLRDVTNETLLQHWRQMFNLRDSTRKNAVVLRVARQRYPFKFVLIDRTHLILQLMNYASDDGALQLWGELQLSDPSGKLTSDFAQIWEDIDNDDETRNAIPADLPPLAAEDPRPVVPAVT